MTHPRFSQRAGLLAGDTSAAWALQDEALARQRAGEPVIFLTVGDPDQKTPASIVEVACAALRRGRTHYSPVPGEPELREAIATKVTRDTGRETSPDEVIVWPGAQSALFAVLSMLVEAGDEVLVAEPYYATYPGVVAASGARLVPVPCTSDASFRVDAGAVASWINERTAAIVLSSPNNPTGATANDATLRALGALASERNLWLVVDEVYSHFTYDGDHCSAWSRGDPARTVVINSVSKTYAMTGWRVGWALAPAPLVSHLINLAEASQFACCQFSQDAAVAALANDPPEIHATLEEYRRRRDFIVATANATPGLRAVRPAGGMFVMLDVTQIDPDDVRFARALLHATDVAVIPGRGFGPSAVGHVRISMTQPLEVLERAMAAIAGYCASA